jgi:hypothetical protein
MLATPWNRGKAQQVRCDFDPGAGTMSGKTATSPQVFRAINRITAAFARAGISKTHANVQDQYQYRSIDDVLNRLAPLLAKHGLCVLPRVLRREAEDRRGEGDTLLISVRLLIAFDLVSCRDGSRYTVKAWGEALDSGDKGTAKAMSSAYKSAMLQLFCVPAAGDDADGAGHRLKTRVREREPVQGWSTWTEDILDMIGVCQSMDALDRVRTRQAALLEALRCDLYATIGQGFSSRAEELSQQSTKTTTAARLKGEPGPGHEQEEASSARAAKAGKATVGVEKVDA